MRPNTPDANALTDSSLEPGKTARNDFPQRVRSRPDPAMWTDIELMSLAEAAALFWPDGPLTTTSLRTAVRDEILDVAEVAGKILTNKASILKMSICGPRRPPDQAATKCLRDRDVAFPRSAAEYSRIRKARTFKGT